MNFEDHELVQDPGSPDEFARPRDDYYHESNYRVGCPRRRLDTLLQDGDFSDDDGFLAAANRAASLGLEGKWAIHPSQINLANTVMTPSSEDISQAVAILEAMDEAKKTGKGAVSLNGKLVDLASIRQAEVLVEKGRQIGLI